MIARSLLITLALVALPARAAAVPAEIVVVVDSSASMGEPAGDGGTKLEAARALALEAIDAASDHRVGLIRFAQLDAVVDTGEGPARVHAEDELQCARFADLLVPVASGTGGAIATWLDGVDAPDNNEVVALGDSPLLGAIEAAVSYLRVRRTGNPLMSCVNAFVVVITDGHDTCGASAEALDAIDALIASGVDEDIRVIVASFDPEADDAHLIADIGHEDPDAARPYDAMAPADFLAHIAAIEGRLAPEACVASGVEPDEIGATGPDDDPMDPLDEGGCCAASTDPGSAAGGIALSLLVAIAFVPAGARRRRLGWFALLGLVAATAIGCGDDGAAPGIDAGPGGSSLVDPDEAYAAALARMDAVIDAAAAARAGDLAPLLDADQVFAGLTGEPVAECTALVRSFGFQPYKSAQQGVAGCLATRRCNSADAALVLEACLAHHAVTAEVQRCAPSPTFRGALGERAAAPAPLVDVSAAQATLSAAMDAAAEPGFVDGLAQAAPRIDEYLDWQITASVAADVAALEPLVDPEVNATATFARGDFTAGLRDHYFVVAGAEMIDPVLAGSEAETGDCVGGAVDFAGSDAASVRVEVVVRHATPDPFAFEPEVIAAEVTYRPHERYGESIAIAIAAGDVTEIPDGVPVPATGDALRALIRVGESTVAGDPFDLAGPGTTIASIALRITTTIDGDDFVADRVLVDRYGYAQSLPGAGASGPMFSLEAARSLLPMRVDIPVIAGVPNQAIVMDRLLADWVARRDELADRLAVRHGVEPAGAASYAPPAMPWSVLGAIARHAEALLPPTGTLLSLRPWQLAVVGRRGFGVGDSGLEVREQTIFDVMDASLMAIVDDTEADAHLAAQLGLGALITEAERLATGAHDRAFFVVNAGAMVREPDTGTWGVWADPGHEAALFPLAVQDAASARRSRGYELIVTPGPAAFGGGEYTAWWRIDNRTAETLGEVRYDGTFYGGAAAIQLVADFDHCLFSAAILALQDGRSIPDTACCIESAVQDFIRGIVLDYISGGMSQLASGLELGMNASAIYMTLEDVSDLTDVVSMSMDLLDFADRLSQPPPCLLEM